MADGGRLSIVALVASTAAISCTITGLAAAYLLPKYLRQLQQQEQQQEQQKLELQQRLLAQMQCDDMSTSTFEAAVQARASCATPEPSLPGVPDHQQDQLQQHQQQQQHQQHLHQTQQRSQQQQQQQQQQGTTADVALFSPINPQKRPDPYDVRARHTYLSWDDYFMAVAFLSAERSKDPNKQVGACIVNDENIILSIGYNGFPRGCADSRLPWAKRAESGSILDTKYPYVVHAEANALLNKNQAHVTGARIYVTLFPCNECAKLLIQAGIREVVYHEAKLEPTGKRPGTMEEAAAEEAAADALEEVDAGRGSGSNSHCCGDSGCGSSTACGMDAAVSAADQQCSTQPSSGYQQAKQQKKKQAFSVGATADLDASYVASQRLLMMAGVKLRQHTLQRSIHLGQHGSSSR